MIIGGIVAAPLDTFVLKMGLLKFPSTLPERRIYASCLLGCLLPLGILFLGLTAKPPLPATLPTVAIGVTTIGIYVIYLASFNYLADTYNESASSALAAQSFCRNVIGGAFPLIGGKMYTNLGVRTGNIVLCGIGMSLCIVPWVLVKWGARIRARSKYATVCIRSLEWLEMNTDCTENCRRISRRSIRGTLWRLAYQRFLLSKSFQIWPSG